ncbi:MAG: Hsp70 family protein, partial [Candidatus Zixiibacteriota bacterium]
MALRTGIDLGTTYSAISWYDSYNNRVETIDLETADGDKVLRSVVYYPGDGNPPVVGETAWNAAKQSPERVIVGIKRSMGDDFKTAPIDDVEYTPQEVSAEILKVLVADAQTFLGEEVKDVVITVPAHFGDNERAATEEAGQLAGLNVLGLLPEPHAAALAFSVEKVADIVDKYLLVYDLGGGTFDVTLIHATTATDADNAINLKIETLCKDGNRQLGGLDWDKVLAEIVAEKVMQEHGVDV